MEEAKSEGNSAFSRKDWAVALERYTACLSLDPLNPVVYANRAAVHLKVRMELGVSKMNEGPHVRGCSGHRTKPKALGRSAQNTLRRK